MAHGDPKLLLDRRASPPRTPNCPVASQTTPEGTPVRLAPSQSAQGALTPQGQLPARLVVVAGPRLSPHLRGSFMLYGTNGADIREGADHDQFGA